jgi:RNase P subunit RPR2
MKPPDVLIIGCDTPKTAEKVQNLFDLAEWAYKYQDKYIMRRCIERIKEIANFDNYIFSTN